MAILTFIVTSWVSSPGDVGVCRRFFRFDSNTISPLAVLLGRLALSGVATLSKLGVFLSGAPAGSFWGVEVSMVTRASLAITVPLYQTFASKLLANLSSPFKKNCWRKFNENFLDTYRGCNPHEVMLNSPMACTQSSARRKRHG